MTNPHYSLRLKGPSPRYIHTLPVRATVWISDALLSESICLRLRYCPNPTCQPQANPTEILRLSLLSPSPIISFSSAFTAAVAADLPSVSQSISPSVRKSVCQSVRPFDRQLSVCLSVNRPSVNRPAVCQPSSCPSLVWTSVRQTSVSPPVNRFFLRPSVNRPFVNQPSVCTSTVFLKE